MVFSYIYNITFSKFIHCYSNIHRKMAINLLYLNTYIGAKSPHLLNMKRKTLLNVGWKCHFQFSQLSQLHEWNFFQLSEWKNYCHFLWLSIYILLLGFAARFTSTRNFSARIISKSNFSFQLGKTSWLPHVAVILWPKCYYLV